MTAKHTIRFKLVFGCLWCDKPIPMKEARKGVMICSKKCLDEMNAKHKTAYDMEDVWKK